MSCVAMSAAGASTGPESYLHLAVSEVETSAWALPAVSLPDPWEPKAAKPDSWWGEPYDTSPADVPHGAGSRK